MKSFLLMIIVICCLLVSGCTNTSQDVLMSPDENSLVHTCNQPENYGNGVLYFNCTEKPFITTLAQYIRDNNVTISTVSGVPDARYYNRVKGYIVVVR